MESDRNMASLLQNISKHIQSLSQFKHVSVVLGNETCDLDSAVSSLVYGLLLDHQKAPDTIVVPVFNIPREHLAVKTEVTFILMKHNVNLNTVICRDEIDLEQARARGALRLTLVDQHALPPADERLAASVTEVIDHRPRDLAWPWLGANVDIRPVGSCCTLVAEKLLARAPQLVSPAVIDMLLGTILLDTTCLSEAVGKATDLDRKMSSTLQALFPSLDGKQLFNELAKAKSDISALTTAQLLIKDLKVTAGFPISGLPIKVKEFLSRDDAEMATKQFCNSCDASVCIIYGSSHGEKDIAVYSDSKPEVASKVVSALLESREPFLDLQTEPCSVPGFALFNQLNIKATRKQILPIVKQVGEKLNNDSNR